MNVGLELDFCAGNAALVHMYAKSGGIDDARLVFDRLEERDVITWNVMTVGLAQRRDGRDAFELLLPLKRQEFKPNAITFMSILNASTNARTLEWVKEVQGQSCSKS